jgi:hypothetical protein
VYNFVVVEVKHENYGGESTYIGILLVFVDGGLHHGHKTEREEEAREEERREQRHEIQR